MLNDFLTTVPKHFLFLVDLWLILTDAPQSHFHFNPSIASTVDAACQRGISEETVDEGQLTSLVKTKEFALLCLLKCTSEGVEVVHVVSI